VSVFDFSRWSPPPSCIFEISNFLTNVTVKRVDLHHRAKFRQNRLNRGWDITIFRFFQDGGRPPSWICYACVGTTHEGHLVVFITAKFGRNRCSSLDNMHIFRFCEFGLKTPIHAQNWGFWEFLFFWPPKWAAMWKIPQKGTSLRDSASFEPSCVKIRRRVWPVREFLKKGV